MYPKLFNVIDSYNLMIIVGVIASILICYLYFKHIKMTTSFILDLTLTIIVAVFFGVIFACLFENLYEFILDPKNYKFTFGLTFYGGLFGGVISFILMYIFYIRKRNGKTIDKICIIAPSAMTIAHAFGRVGCFLAGCCYGKETNEWYGIYFESLGKKVIPTQLYEAIFLFILSFILIYLAFKKNFKYNFIIYITSYSIWRFLIEFLRDDPRGAFLGIFSPSQVWSIILFCMVVPLYFFLNRYIFKKDINDNLKNEIK